MSNQIYFLYKGDSLRAAFNDMRDAKKYLANKTGIPVPLQRRILQGKTVNGYSLQFENY